LNGGSPPIGSIKDQDALIEAVAAAQPNTIVVMTVPGATLMPWSPKVKALLTNFMPGQQCGNAITCALSLFLSLSLSLSVCVIACVGWLWC
jgi:hypothetical protein